MYNNHGRASSASGCSHGQQSYSRNGPQSQPGMTTIDPRQLMLASSSPSQHPPRPTDNVSAQQMLRYLTSPQQQQQQQQHSGSDFGATRTRRPSAGGTVHPYSPPLRPRRRSIAMEPTNHSGQHNGLNYYLRIPPNILPAENRYDNHAGINDYKPSVCFRFSNSAEYGVVIKVVGNKTLPAFEGYNDEIFAKLPERGLSLRMTWPGYAPFGCRMNTNNGKMTRSEAFAFVATYVHKHLATLKLHGVKPQLGYEKWDLTQLPFDLGDLVITGLIHRGGSTWQPDVWCPNLL
ncbi:hypothetical protein K435DRAFT_841317 [Dendrothele bispora CBS 962.96]|uniref:Uncharacterized protein n=1 Tax=Dendrothele bispora (strain CBS 962.96) TaxID=1314807 RepID=A0A4S8LN95_DENBC|nr:hypothetical protein K435DRAFT_841317 [Dendrothele bispora CBS 962.96]